LCFLFNYQLIVRLNKIQVMKRTLIGLLVCLVVLTASAQYPQNLPVDYKSFFAETAIGSDSKLEKGEYTNTTQDGTNPVLADQWNKSGKVSASEGRGVSPSIEISKLSYSAYADNNAGKAIILNPSTASTRSTIYSLTSGSEYTNGAFYLSALINISDATTNGDQFLSFDGNYTGNQQRARVCVKSSPNRGYFNIGLGWNAVATSWSADLTFGTTYLIVVKVTPSAKGAESASLFINPVIGGKETAATEAASVSGNADLKRIRSIYIRQRSNLGGKIAGLRFSNNWADAVK
jgi:hypothetical protein